jgi:uncharacterized DUF497 family protein
MKDSLYSWDEEKNKINKRKHGVSFEEAESVFDDDNLIFRYDEEHSIYEDRYIVIGKSKKSRVLIVFYCYWENDTITRIISARKANKFEHMLYGGVR